MRSLLRTGINDHQWELNLSPWNLRGGKIPNPAVLSALDLLTLKVLVVTIDAQWEGMGDVGSARYEPALLPSLPDHKDFKLQQLVNFQKFSTLRVKI